MQGVIKVEMNMKSIATRKSVRCLMAALAGICLQSVVTGAESPLPAVQMTPAETVFALEIARPLKILEPLLAPETVQAFAASPIWARIEEGPQFQGLARAVGFLELQMGTDWQTALKKLIGGGVTLAAQSSRETILTIEAQDANSLDQFIQSLQAFIKAATQNNPALQGAEQVVHGVKMTSFGRRAAWALADNRLMIANSVELMERALELRANKGANSFGKSAAYTAARTAAGPDAAAIFFADMTTVRSNPKLQQALAKNLTPLPALLVGHLREAFKKANWLSISLDATADGIRIKAVADAPASEAPRFAVPQANDGVLPNLSVPGQLAGISLYRDLRAFYQAKDELFPERTSGLVFFENMMGIFFSGLHISEGVLAEVDPHIRLVAAVQQYDPEVGIPAIKIPAFAAVMKLRHPQEFGEVVEEAWQKAIGMASFTRGQKGLPGFLIDRSTNKDVKISVAYYRPPKDADLKALEPRFNFRPTLARTGDYVILSSADGLARQLVEAVKKEASATAKPLPRTHTAAEIDVNALVKAAVSSREPLIQRMMIGQGRSREQASEQLDNLLTWLDCMEKASLEGLEEDGRFVMYLTMKLRAPDAKRIKSPASSGGSK